MLLLILFFFLALLKFFLPLFLVSACRKGDL